MNDLIIEKELKVSITQMPVITSSLPLLKNKVEMILEKYNFIVGEDDIKMAKSSATELNKLANTLDTLRKEKVKEISLPITEFEKETKEIHSIIKETRQSLLNQIAKFENETKQNLEKLLKSELVTLNKLYDIQPEFQKTQYEDLVKISNLTKGGRLTKKTSDELTKRVLEDKQMQDKIQARLIALDGVCLKAGLETPLQKHNVQHFLFSDTYEEELKNLIDVELKRQDETKRRLAQQIEDKRRREEEALKKTQKAEEKQEIQEVKETIKETISETNKPISQSKPANNNHSKYLITVTMELETKDMDIEMLKRFTQNKFVKCGFKSIQDISIVKQNHSSDTKSDLVAAGSLF